MADIYLLIEAKQEGPYTEEQVKKYLAERQITNDVLAWREGLTEWVAVSNVLSEPTAWEEEQKSEAQTAQKTFGSGPLVTSKRDNKQSRTRINEKQVQVIVENFRLKRTEELQAIWINNDHREYSEEGFEAVRRVHGSDFHDEFPNNS